MPAESATLAELYLAYLGRPMDAYGARSYGAPATVLAPEAFRPFWESGEMPQAEALQVQVQTLYRRLFQREGSDQEVAHWAGAVTSGAVPAQLLPIAVLQAARGADAESVANKLAAAQAFFDRLDTPAEKASFAGEASAAIARAFLDTVGSDPASLAAATQASLDTVVAQAVAAGVPPPATFRPTAGRDVVNPTEVGDAEVPNDGFGVSTSSGDQFVLDSVDGQPVVGQGDVIDGGAGLDALWLTVRGEALSTAADRITQVELAHLTVGGTGAIDLSGVTDLQAVTLSSIVRPYPVFEVTPGTLTVSGLASSAAVTSRLYQGTAAVLEFADRAGPGEQTVTLDLSDHLHGTLTLPEIEHVVVTTGSDARAPVRLGTLVAQEASSLRVQGAGLLELGQARLAEGATLTFDVDGFLGGSGAPLTVAEGARIVVEGASGGLLTLDDTIASVVTRASGDLVFSLARTERTGQQIEINAEGTGAIRVLGTSSNVAVVAQGGAASDTFASSRAADRFTGGGGADDFIFAAADALATDAAGLLATADTITDFSFTDHDRIWVAGSLNAGTGADAATAGAARIAGGVATFHASDDTLREKVAAVAASLKPGAELRYEFAVFTHGADSWLYVSNAEAGVNAGDVLVRLAGVQMDASHFMVVNGTLVGV